MWLLGAGCLDYVPGDGKGGLPDPSTTPSDTVDTDTTTGDTDPDPTPPPDDTDVTPTPTPGDTDTTPTPTATPDTGSPPEPTPEPTPDTGGPPVPLDSAPAVVDTALGIDTGTRPPQPGDTSVLVLPPDDTAAPPAISPGDSGQ
jgi:hypothetical protein